MPSVLYGKVKKFTVKIFFFNGLIEPFGVRYTKTKDLNENFASQPVT